MNNLTRKKPGRPEPDRDAERRRVGRVVHDDRGNASVSWRDAPADFERPVLEVLGEPGLTLKSDETYDPYAHRPARGASNVDGASNGNQTSHRSGSNRSGSNRSGGNRSGGNRGSGARTDLRRLSDWIKMMRELEQRKREGGGEGESGG